MECLGEFLVLDRTTCEDAGGEPCPAKFALDLIGHKWSLHILIRLLKADGPIRFGQLRTSIAGISQRELTKHLREFERCGLVSRRIHAEVPPRVDYAVTDLGRSLLEPMQALNNWAVRRGSEIQACRSTVLASPDER